MMQRFVLEHLDAYDAAVRAGDLDSAKATALQLGNRCAQAMILLERRQIQLPPEDDPCWEQWAAEDSRQRAVYCAAVKATAEVIRETWPLPKINRPYHTPFEAGDDV